MKRINNILLELYEDKYQLLALSVICCASYWLQLLLPSSPNLNQAAGAMIAIAAGGALISTGVSMYNGAKNRKAADSAATKANEEKTKQLALLTEEKEKYKSFKFINPYASAKNEFANIQTKFENTYEDLTVNQQQAQFQAQQGAQSRANIMQTMQGAAGGSGIASLAQAMANQGQLATQQASASIGQQESRNQTLSAQGAGAAQTAEAAAQTQIARGEESAQGLRLRGEEMVARQEADRSSTLLGIQASMAGGAAQAATSADQMSLQTDMQARNATTGAITSGIGAVTGAAIGGMNADGMSEAEFANKINEQSAKDYGPPK